MIELGAKDIAVFLAAIVTVATALAAYVGYRKRRLFYPRKKVSHRIVSHTLSDEKTFVRVEAKICNVGEVPIHLSWAKITLRRVIPCTEDFYKSLINGKSCPTGKSQEISWPILGTRFWDWGSGELELEPGEARSISGDFVIDHDIRAVESYSFVVDSLGDRDPIVGWSMSEIHELTQRTLGQLS